MRIRRCIIALVTGITWTALPLIITSTILVSASGQSSIFSRVSVNAYGELYYGYDFSNPEDHERPFFVYNHKRHNEVNANLLLVRATYADSLVRANLGLMAGTYAHYNLAAEPEWARFIYEASIGLRLSRRKAIWLDAGIMPAHMGWEGAVGADCWTLTRSLAAEGSPYYETGIKASYAPDNGRWTMSLMLLNGWQRIQRPDGFQAPAFGLQVTHRPSAKLTLNYSNFIGSDKPDAERALRVFHDLYAVWQPDDRFGITAGFDLGTESASHAGTRLWFTPTVILRYTPAPKWNMILRAEHYSDPDGVIFASSATGNMVVTGLSAGVDVRLSPVAMVRLEGKTYLSEDPIFPDSKSTNTCLTAALAVRL